MTTKQVSFLAQQVNETAQEMAEEEQAALVVKNGSGVVKAGFAGTMRRPSAASSPHIIYNELQIMFYVRLD